MRRACLFVLVLMTFASCSREGGPGAGASPSAASAPSSASSQATGSDDPAKAAFVRAANAACREYARKDEALAEPEDVDDYVTFMKDFIRIGDELQTKLRALPVPPDDAKGIEGYLGGNDEQARILKDALPKMEAAARSDDAAAADDAYNTAIDEFNRISSSQDPFARSYGLTDCANPVEDDGSSVAA